VSKVHTSPGGVVQPRLKMSYAGAAWLRKNLSYEKKPRTLSRFGEAVADLLGFVWAGLYHMPHETITRADWSNERSIEIRIGDTLATWDFNELTRLVILSHDMGIRVQVGSCSNRTMSVFFSARDGRYAIDVGERGEGMSIATHMPTLEEHVAAVRQGYTVVVREDVEDDEQ
jgi:hypothetical protein